MKTVDHLIRGAAAAGFLVTCSIGTAQAADKCGSLTSFGVPNHTVSISKAEMVAAGPAPRRNTPGAPPGADLPAHCLVEGMIDQRTGAGGKTYGIGFAVALPADWNGRFLFQGGGGLDGVLNPPLGPIAAGDKPALARGFAVASTDSGHQAKAVFDASFMADQQAVVDFQYASIGTVTDLAKQIIAAYYGKPAAHSYFTGCSMGGREAMIAAQRYPLKFDGVISGAPAMRVGWSGIGDKWVSTVLNTVAPKGADGKPEVAKIFSPAEKKLVINGILKACDAKDGLKDGMIFNVAQCHFDPEMLACKGEKTDSCLSHKQAAAIKRAMAGPKDSKGHQVYPGFYYDTGLAARRPIPGLLNPGPSPVGGTNYQTKMDVDAEAAAAAANPANATGDTAHWVQLNSFYQKGGKLIFFHGVSDPWFSAQDTVRYYKQMATANGGADKVRAMDSRLFLVPGMGHCGGGPATLDRFDLLSKLVDWVENGKAPASVTATGRDFPGRSRPLCAYPKHAQYTGKGDPENAQNFTCQD
ncbi:MAG TPA: tannase/feruloyl esterase family alpha/beta hydrolase [Alphaproteobacteria bacterium]|nr:tannase/feruloyl esterase family alpha/beta hydrolase [Alphaproteobacteria bacterium]